MTVEVRLIGPEGNETHEFDDAAADRLCRPTSIELLRTVAREEPTSIREAARLVDRDVRQVHDNLWKLGELGLVEFDRSGQSHRPFVTYDRIEIDIDL
ncbi:MAG: putative transcriptional regulator [Natronomonas sp.]|jgi:predicted transcriptional regulator